MGRRGRSAKTQRDNGDKISQLPDDVLVSILGRMTMKEGGRSCVLSRRWSKLWTLIPSFNFDASHILLDIMSQKSRHGLLEKERIKYLNWVNRVLDSYRGPSTIDELVFIFELDATHGIHIDRWIQFAREKNVKRLNINFNIWGHNAYSFPRLSSPDMTSLRVIELTDCEIGDDVFHYFISNCRFLEKLEIERSDSLVHLNVAGPSLCLCYLKISHCFEVKSIFISATNLWSLEYYGQVANISYADVPNLAQVSFGGDYTDCILYNSLELSNYASQLKEVTLDFNLKEDGRSYDFPLMRNLKNVKVKVEASYDHSLVVFAAPLIKASPCLQVFKLELELDRSGVRDDEEVPECRHECLKVVELVGFVGRRIDIDFVSFVSVNAIMLDKLVIDPLKPGSSLVDPPLKDIHAIKKRAIILSSKFSKLELRNF